VRGKMAYIAPEQLQNSAADRKADVYAAAVVLWEALTGERLFLGESESATIAKVLAGEMLPPSSVVPDIPRALDEVVMRGLNRDRSARFETARDMARALEACGPLPTATQIGEWVEETAGTALANRARIVSQVEQIEDFPSAEGSSRPPRIFASSEEPTAVEIAVPDERKSGIEAAPDFQPERRRRVVIIAAVAGFLLGAIGLWLAVPAERPLTQAKVGPATPTLGSPVPRETHPAPTTVPEPAPAPVPSATATAPAPSATSTHTPQPEPSAKKPPPIPRPKAKPAAKTDCDPPYTIDQDGHRHYKMECL